MAKELLLTVRAKNLASPVFSEVSREVKKPFIPRTLKVLGLIALGYEFRKLFNAYLRTQAELENYLIQIQIAENISKEEAYEILSQLKSFARILPFETSDIIRAWILLHSAGFPVTIEHLKIIADTAFVFNRTMTDVASAMVSQETRVLRNLGLIITKEHDKYRIVAGKLQKEIDANRISLFNAILEAQKQYEGASSRAYYDVSGLIMIFRSEWWEFLALIREKGLADYILAALFTLEDFILKKKEQGILKGWAERISERLTYYMDIMVKASILFLQSLKEIIGTFASLYDYIVKFGNFLSSLTLRVRPPEIVIEKKTIGIGNLEKSKNKWIDALDNFTTAYTQFWSDVNQRYSKNREETKKTLELIKEKENLELQTNLDRLKQEELEIQKRRERIEEEKKREEERRKYFENLLKKMQDFSEALVICYERDRKVYAKTIEEEEQIRAYYQQRWIEAIKHRYDVLIDMMDQDKLLTEEAYLNYTNAFYKNARELKELLDTYYKKFGSTYAQEIQKAKVDPREIIGRANELLSEIPLIDQYFEYDLGKAYSSIPKKIHEFFTAKGIKVEGKTYPGFFEYFRTGFINDVKATAKEIRSSLSYRFNLENFNVWFSDVFTSSAVQRFFSLVDTLFHPNVDNVFLSKYTSSLKSAIIQSAEKLAVKFMAKLFGVAISELGWFFASLNALKLVRGLFSMFGLKLGPGASGIGHFGWLMGITVNPIYGGLIGAFIGTIIGAALDALGFFKAEKTIYQFAGPFYSIAVTPTVLFKAGGIETAVTIDHLMIPSLAAQFSFRLMVLQKIAEVKSYVREQLVGVQGRKLGATISIAYYKALANCAGCEPGALPSAIFVSNTPEGAIGKMYSFLMDFAYYYIDEAAFCDAIYKVLPPEYAGPTYSEYAKSMIESIRSSLITPRESEEKWKWWKESVYSESTGIAVRKLEEIKHRMYYTSETYWTEHLTPVYGEGIPKTFTIRTPTKWEVVRETVVEKRFRTVKVLNFIKKMAITYTVGGVEKTRWIDIYSASYYTYPETIVKTIEKKVPTKWEEKVIQYTERRIKGYLVRMVPRVSYTPIISPEEQELLSVSGALGAYLYHFRPGKFMTVSYGKERELARHILPEEIFNVTIIGTDLEGNPGHEKINEAIDDAFRELNKWL